MTPKENVGNEKLIESLKMYTEKQKWDENTRVAIKFLTINDDEEHYYKFKLIF
jgi:hypothetical protein